MMNTDKPTKTASASQKLRTYIDNEREPGLRNYIETGRTIPAEKPTDLALFDPSKLAIDFDPYRSFDSVDEAIAYCEKQPEPITAVMAIACANILLGEFGFASEVVWEAETMAICCPDVMPDNRD